MNRHDHALLERLRSHTDASAPAAERLLDEAARRGLLGASPRHEFPAAMFAAVAIAATTVAWSMRAAPTTRDAYWVERCAKWNRIVAERWMDRW